MQETKALFMNSNITYEHYAGDKGTVHGSHGTIHTFKNYFVTVFLVFSFNKNKLYPNGPQMVTSKEDNKDFEGGERRL